MGDKSLKAKQRDQKQKDAAKIKSTAAAKSKQDSYSVHFLCTRFRSPLHPVSTGNSRHTG